MKRQNKHIPVRMCAICRNRFPKEELTRYARVDARFVPDEKKTQMGKGIYVCSDERCKNKWMKRIS